MAPIWLHRLNDILTWLNPALALFAAVLAAMVIAEAGEHIPRKATNPAVQAARPAAKVAPDIYVRPAVPTEWRDMLLHD